jgi:hypothetical protein
MLGACAAAAALMMLSVAAWGAESETAKPDQNPQPWVTMSLGTLGVPAIPQSFIQVGSSMLTLHLVDDTHILLTFSSRGLVPREPGDSPEEECRMVAAELVELPSGKILARADWKMHDHGRYLWRLGKGRFLLRTKNDLYLLTPEARLHTAEPLRLARFPVRDGVPVTAMITADKGLVTVETVAPQKKETVVAASGSMIVTDPKQAVMVDFYRLSGGDAPGVPMTVKGAGVVKAPGPVMLPMDADGYLWPDDGGHGRWPVSFNEFGGHEVKIVQLDSSCQPRLQMVSRFEFLAFTCHGSEARVRMRSYGMDGHETWEETLSGTFGTPELAYAPESGRFALSRIVANSDLLFGSVVPDGATQEVRVYQTESGNLLLRVPTTPVTRYAENFDLSEDGLVAAVLSSGMIQVYKLPVPSEKDMKDLDEAKSFSPPRSEAQVRFAKLEGSENGAESTAAGADVAAAAAAPANRASGSGGAAAAADAQKDDADAAVNAATAGGGGGKADTVADAAVSAPGQAAANEISDDEARAAMRKDVVAGGDPAGGDAAAGADPDPASAGKRKPPTLLEPGETVEKVKPPAQAQQPSN